VLLVAIGDASMHQPVAYPTCTVVWPLDSNLFSRSISSSPFLCILLVPPSRSTLDAQVFGLCSAALSKFEKLSRPPPSKSHPAVNPDCSVSCGPVAVDGVRVLHSAQLVFGI
jgi:hypothetical protein